MNRTVTAVRSITQGKTVTQAQINEVVDVLAEELGAHALIDILISKLEEKAITVLTDVAEEIGLGKEVRDHLRAEVIAVSEG